MTRQLEYSALTDSVSKADIDEYKRRQKTTPPHPPIVENIAAVLIAIAGILLFVSLSQNVGWRNAVMVVALAGAIIYIIGLYSKNSLHRSVRLYKFSKQNGLALLTGVQEPRYAGMIFDNGHTRKIIEAVQFIDGVEIGYYVYVTGSGKNQKTHAWSYAKVKLARRLPHMVLDAKSNNFWKFSNLSDPLKRSQAMELEGDFNNYFTLYAPEQYRRDALYVFTPDVMAAMIDHGKDYDIEIVDDELYIYTKRKFSLDDPALYPPLLSIIDTLRGELVNQTDYYADDRVGNRELNIVAPGGARLAQGFNWAVMIFILYFVYWFVIMPLMSGR